MLWVARILVGLAGVFSLAMGLNAWIAPQRLGAALGITGVGDMGINSLRADLGAFFLASAIVCGAALLAGRVRWLYMAALLYGLAAAGRIIGVLAAGAPDGVAGAIVVEVALVAVLLFGARTLRAP